MTMNKTGKTSRKQDSSSEQIKADKSPQTDKKKPIKPKQFKKAAQEAIGEKYQTIVNAFAEKASKGSVQHTKLLFDLGGVKEEVRAVSSKRYRTPSLGKLLLEEAKSMKCKKDEFATGSSEVTE